MAPALDRDRIIQAFEALGADLAERGPLIEIAVYGGGALTLQLAWRRGTGDIDAVVRKGAMFWPDERALRGYLLCVSPVAFRVRLIFTGTDPLQRARFPYHRGVVRDPLTFPPEGAGMG